MVTVNMSPAAVAQRDRVHAYIAQKGRAACFEVEAGLGLKNQTASARIRELTILGHLFDTEKRVLNPRKIEVVLWEPCERPPNFDSLRPPNPYVGHSTDATRKKIEDALRNWGPCTYDEIAMHTGILHQTVTPAIADMMLLGTVVNTGTKRKTRFNGTARVIALPAPATTGASPLHV